MSDLDPNVTVSHEQDGRVLSGVGVTKESLAETMDARSVDETTVAPVPAGTSSEVATAQEQPKQTRGQARFSELTQKAKDAEAKAEAAEKRAADAEARLSQQQPAREERPLGTAAAPAAEAAASRPAPSRPEPTEDEVGVGLKYETYGAFVKDHHQWSWEQQQATINDSIRQGIVAHQNALAFQTHVETTRAKGRAAYKDFDAMLKSGPGTYVNMPTAAINEIYSLPNSEHVQYAIMKDGALAQRLAALAASNPYAFGLELAMIAPAAPAATPASTGNPGSVTPPAPMQPVGSGSSTTRRSSADANEFLEYQGLRNVERGVTRRR